MRIHASLEKMTIRRLVMTGFGGIMALVLVMLVAGALVLAPLTKDIRDYGDSTLARSDAASEIALAVKAMGNNGVVGIVGGSSQSSYAVSQTETKRQAVLAALDRAAQSLDGASAADDVEATAELLQLRALVDEYDSALKTALLFRVANATEARIQLVAEVIPIGEELDAAAATYYERQRGEAMAEADGLTSNANMMWVVLCVVAGLVLAGGSVVSLVIPRTIGAHLTGAAIAIDGSTTNMLSTASQVAAGVSLAASATNQTTATVEEVKQTAALAEDSALELAKNSENVAAIADSSRAQANSTIHAHRHIQDQMDSIADAIDRLSDQTQAVAEIMATVKDLAEQSNILSMNASIEAAKAGKQGRGFAVVAQEVKSLAEQSKGAVNQVQGILTEIAHAAKTAVQAAGMGRQAISAGSAEIERSKLNAQALAEAADDTAKSAAKISASSRQQLAGMEQISNAVCSINNAGNQSVEGTRQVEDEVRRLQQLSYNLRHLVGADSK